MPARLGIAILVGLAAVISASGAAAQNLAFTLFERYLEPLRVQAGIPGLAGVILQNGQVVWERGLGLREIEGSHPALPDSPFYIGDLTQTLTATLLLSCAEHGGVQVDEPIGRTVPGVESPQTTLRQLVTHAAPNMPRGFRYEPGRYALLARPIESCASQTYRNVVARELFDRLAMIDAVPGRDVGTLPLEQRDLFDAAALQRYAAALARQAAPYKVDRRGRASRADFPAPSFDGATGIVASARDLAKFDAALDRHILLRPETLAQSWTNATHNSPSSPFGMGWFVQTYEGEKLVWHFGYTPDAYSSLYLKVPGRRLTLILLANSDGLSAPFALHEGDVTSSLFARTFLKLFL